MNLVDLINLSSISSKCANPQNVWRLFRLVLGLEGASSRLELTRIECPDPGFDKDGHACRSGLDFTGAIDLQAALLVGTTIIPIESKIIECVMNNRVDMLPEFVF